MSDENEGGTPKNNQENNQQNNQKPPLPDNVVQGTFGFLKDVFNPNVPFKEKIWGIAVIAFGALFIIAGYNFIVSDKTVFEFVKEARSAFSSNEPPQLDKSKYVQIGKSLTKDGAKTVSIYEVDLGGVSRTLVYSIINGEESKDTLGDRDSLYSRLGVRDNDADKLRKANYNEMVFRMQNGEFTCQNLEPSTRHGAFLAKNDVKYTCAIGIPTGFTKYFVGAIVVGFDKEFDSSQEDFMRSSLAQAGQDILIKQ